MKTILIFLITMGLLFAGGQFPQEIPGTGLKMLESTGDASAGSANYATDDGVTVAILAAETISSSEWNNIKDQYEESGISKKIDSGVTYYYFCEKTGEETQCFMDCYKNGVYYTIDLSTIGGSETQTLNTGLTAGRTITQQGGGAGDGSPIPCCCSSVLLVGLFTVLAVARKNV